LSKFERGLNIAIGTIGVAMVVYHLIGVFLHPLEPALHANTHLSFVLLIVFLPVLQTALQKGQRLGSIAAAALILLSVLCVVYIYLFHDELVMRTGDPLPRDVVIGSILVILVIEACRRTQGIVLPLFAGSFIAYALFGQYLPRPFYHLPVPFGRLISWFGISLNEGIFGGLIFLSANIIFLFILFGTVLEITKARDFFTMVGIWVGRKIRGGPAQTSVASSALVGSITGSPVANIIITGAVTIPLMKKTGFRPAFAAGVEAVASSGGILLPPVMGAVVFMMMGLTGFPYLTICMAALVPALLYYFGIGWSIYLYARKAKIVPGEEKVDTRVLLRRAPLFIIPFGLIVALLALQFSPMYAAGWAMVSALALGCISKETRPDLRTLVDALTRGAKSAAAISAMMVLANAAFISVMGLTGIGPKICGVIGNLSGGHLILVLMMTMVASLLLGCVAPVAGAYLIVAIVVTPLLVDMGLNVMQAHFFALVFSVLGFLTPPAAPSAIVAAGVANTSFMKTAMQGLRLVAPAFLLPFLFSYNPALLLQSSGLTDCALAIIAALLIFVSFPIVLFGHYLTKVGWAGIGLAAVSVVSLMSYFLTRGRVGGLILGAALFTLLTLWQWKKAKAGEREANG
jgi:TRAP transporter 4TM/12TM fusion protein